jgi:hypothetical protein
MVRVEVTYRTVRVFDEQILSVSDTVKLRTVRAVRIQINDQITEIDSGQIQTSIDHPNFNSAFAFMVVEVLLLKTPRQVLNQR